MRLILAFVILLFMFSICTVIVQDRAILVSLWQMSPVLYSFAYSVANTTNNEGKSIRLVTANMRPVLHS